MVNDATQVLAASAHKRTGDPDHGTMQEFDVTCFSVAAVNEPMTPSRKSPPTGKCKLHGQLYEVLNETIANGDEE
jgi:hypothetical protein